MAIKPVLAVCIGIVAASAAAFAVDTPTSTSAPDLTHVRASIKAKDFKAAIGELNGIIDKGVQTPMSTVCWASRCARAATTPRP